MQTSGCEAEVYSSIVEVTKKIWEAQFNEAQELVDKYADKSLCAALAKAESLVWIFSMENSDEAYEKAINSYNQLEDETLRIYETCKPSSLLSSIVRY